MWRSARASGLIGFREIHLLRRESLLAIDGGPGRRSVPAAKELLVYVFVAAAAVPSRQLRTDYETVMIFLVLSLGRLVAIQAIHALLRVPAHLVFVDHGILCPGMTFGALPAGAHECGARLLGFYLRSRAIENERSQYQSKGYYDGDKHRPKRHVPSL
jgi:hypothetical protein